MDHSRPRSGRAACLLVGLTSISSLLNAQTLEWGFGIGGANNEMCTDIVCDQDGNGILVGEYFPPMDFDPGPGSTILTGDMFIGVGFIAKYSEAGSLLWAHTTPGVGQCTADADGNIWLATAFFDTVDVDPGPGVVEMFPLPGNQADLLIVKYDPSGGLLWAGTYGSVYNDFAHDIQADGNGNVLLTGSLYNTSMDLDPGPGVTAVTGYQYLSKLDPNGALIWAHGLMTGYSMPLIVDVDQWNNVYLHGDAPDGPTDYDPGPADAFLDDRGFLAKYDPAGAFVWARGFDLTSGWLYTLELSVTSDASILIGGNLNGQVDLDPGPGTMTMTSTTTFGDHYFARYDANGDLVLAKIISTNAASVTPFFSAHLTETDDIFMAGRFDGVVDFDPGPGTSTLNSAAGITYMAQYDGSGNYVTAFAQESGALNAINLLNTDPAGHAWLVGMTTEATDLQPGPGVFNVLSSTPFFNDIYVAKYEPLSTGLGASHVATGLLIGPNPTNALVTGRLPEGAAPIASIELSDLYGRALNVPIMVGGNGSFSMDLTRLATAAYSVVIQDREGVVWRMRVVRD